MSTSYNVYANSGVGDPINYTSPVAVVANGTLWNTAALPAGGDYRFGVRAFDTITGLEEQNIDCVVEIVLDANGKDITNQPVPPIGMRAFATEGGGIKVEWFHVRTDRSRDPVGFNVYVGVGGTPDYEQPAAIVAYSSAVMNTWYAVLSGLTDGTSYAIGVRAYNWAAEETNDSTVIVVAKVTGPMPVVGLIATTIV
jgi:hypothetical protein